MEKKNFWLFDSIKKRNAIKDAVKQSFGKDAFIHDFSINSGNTDGYIVIGYYGDILTDSELNSFSGFLHSISAHSSFSLRRKHDDNGIYYLSIVYCFIRNK